MVSAAAVLLTAAAAALTVGGARPPMDPEMAELAAMLREGCVESTGVAPALLAAVDAGGDLPPDGAFKCYLKCTMETAGMMSEGVVDVEAVLALLPDPLRALLGEAVRACGTGAGADHCDAAFSTQRCWRDADPANYFII